jgi:hypothetical protein
MTVFRLIATLVGFVIIFIGAYRLIRRMITGIAVLAVYDLVITLSVINERRWWTMAGWLLVNVCWAFAIVRAISWLSAAVELVANR